MLLIAGVLGGSSGLAQSSDLENCRQIRQQRNLLASQAMEQEIALVRTFRDRICPRLAAQAEGANAKDQAYVLMDYAAWNRCRLEAERQLESSTPLLYRNRQRFTFYTVQGAALARQADLLSAEIEAKQCLSP